MLQYKYTCSKCKTEDVQNTDALPANWTKLTMGTVSDRGRSKKSGQIIVHLCDACRQLCDIPVDEVVDEKTPEEQLLELIEEIARGAGS